MSFERYAIYWAPEDGSPLAEFGRRWLGGETGPAARDSFGLNATLVEQATRSPRRYRLHATMKAPFRLAPDTTQGALADALAAFCTVRRCVRAGPLRLHRFSRFLALVPDRDRAEIEWLEAQCVTYFDRYRAPLNDADRARRSGEMSPLEGRFFEEFGYPYIFSRFFFHITLAGPLSADELVQVEAALSPAVAQFAGDDFVIRSLCLFGDPGGGAAFQPVGRYSFMR